jgi:DNA-binding response OmpR family regulator
MANANPWNRSSRPTILIVDDSLTFRNTLGDRLRRDGYDVLLAESWEEAVDALNREPDAVIVDLEMPGVDGVETCRRIRRATEGTALPILMLTARDDLPARIRGRYAGADEFQVKGPDFAVVVAGVTDFLRRTTSGQGSGQGPADTSVFAKVVAASGLAPIIAETAIVRACQRAGVEARAMSATDLLRALPDIERSLSMFLAPADRATRLEAVAAIVGRSAVRSGDGG